MVKDFDEFLKSDFRFIFFDEISYAHVVYVYVMRLVMLTKKLFDLAPFSDKTKGLKSLLYHDWYRDLK